MANVTKTITAENTYTDWISPSKQLALGINQKGYLNLSIYGTFTATVTVQRSFDGGTTILDVVEYTAPAERIVEDHEVSAIYRVGVKTGDFTSDTAYVRLGI